MASMFSIPSTLTRTPASQHMILPQYRGKTWTLTSDFRIHKKSIRVRAETITIKKGTKSRVQLPRMMWDGDMLAAKGLK